MPFQVTFLGTAGATPSAERNPSSFLLKREGELILFDCGEGTQRQMMKAATGMAIDKIFLTHYHGDHFLGIPGLIQTLSFQGRKKPLKIIGPIGLRNLTKKMAALGSNPHGFDLLIQEIEPGEEIVEEEYVVEAIETDHGEDIESLGYVFREKKRPGKFNREKAINLGIEPGPKFGKLQNGETVNNKEGEQIKPKQVMGSPRRGRKLVYTGDTRPLKEIKKKSNKADVLIHDSTLTENEKERAKETKHSTAKEAAETAEDSDVKLLCLFHLSNRYSKDFYPLLNEAKRIFEDTIVPKDFTKLNIPYPEKEREIEIDI